MKAARDRFTLRLNARVQPFYRLNVLRAPFELENAFEIRRARIELRGNAHTPALRYMAQLDLGRGFLTLKDFYFDGELGRGAWLRVGQWKRPFSRQFITSAARLELTDRAITDRAFRAGRDIGVAVHNQYEESPPFEWVAGLFNGTGDAPWFVPELDPETGEIVDGEFTNVPRAFKPAIAARAGLNRGGIRGYREADLEGGPLRYAIAADLHLEGDVDDEHASRQKLSADYIVKAHGFSSTGAAYMMTVQTGRALTDLAVALLGFHLQVGYMVTRHLQGAARYAFVDVRHGGAGAKQELAVGANWYAYGHDAKLAVTLRWLRHVELGFVDGVLLEVGANVGF